MLQLLIYIHSYIDFWIDFSLSGIVNCRPAIQNKWTTPWLTAQKVSKSTNGNNKNSLVNANVAGQYSRQSSKNGDLQQQPLQQQQQQGGYSSKKGKVNKFKRIQNLWSWKAGAGWTILSVLDWWLLAAGGWLTWRGVFLKWTPLGICIIAAVQWHYLTNDERNQKGLPRTASAWQVWYLVLFFFFYLSENNQLFN